MKRVVTSLVAFLVLALAYYIVEGRRAAPPPVRLPVAEATEPSWYRGLQLEVGAPRGGAHFLFWPHEAVTTDALRPVERSQVYDFESAEGVTSWRVRDLGPPGLELAVRLVAGADALSVTYTVVNGTDEPRRVTIDPCLQLTPDFFAGLPEAAFVDHVFVPARGWQRISQTKRTPGLGDPANGVAPRPFTQHYFSPLADARARESAAFLPFGVSADRVTESAIAALEPGGRGGVAVATDHGVGVTFALLRCLHAVIELQAPAGGSAAARYVVVFQAGTLADLAARLAGDLDLKLPRNVPAPLAES